jgi:mRNA interferase MazF
MTSQKKQSGTEKPFDRRNDQKKIVDARQKTKSFKERDIVFLQIGENVGSEQNGKGEKFLRPVLVYKKFSDTLFLGIPLTSQKKKESRFYAEFSFREKKSTAILSQIRLFDAKRIEYWIGQISKGNYNKIKKKLIGLLQ